jgi:hypothetical protein
MKFKVLTKNERKLTVMENTKEWGLDDFFPKFMGSMM